MKHSGCRLSQHFAISPSISHFRETLPHHSAMPLSSLPDQKNMTWVYMQRQLVKHYTVPLSLTGLDGYESLWFLFAFDFAIEIDNTEVACQTHAQRDKWWYVSQSVPPRYVVINSGDPTSKVLSCGKHSLPAFGKDQLILRWKKSKNVNDEYLSSTPLLCVHHDIIKCKETRSAAVEGSPQCCCALVAGQIQIGTVEIADSNLRYVQYFTAFPSTSEIFCTFSLGQEWDVCRYKGD